MALYHVHADVISKGKAVGGSAGFARYITREVGHAEQHAASLGRESYPGNNDLVDKGHGGPLPEWAKDGIHFFHMADRYSHKTATIARVYEIALPRELDGMQRAELAADLRATFFERYPFVYAVHNPIDRHGGEHPHMHLMLSERRQIDTVERGPKMYFKYAAREGRDPATGGVGADRSWHGPDRLRELRKGVATLTNAALERAGAHGAVSHHSLKTLGYGRDPVVYTHARDKQAVEAHRAILRQHYHPGEQDVNRLIWDEQKVAEGLRDISRAAIVDHVRDHFWRHDRSPARVHEREASLERALAREWERTGDEALHVDRRQTHGARGLPQVVEHRPAETMRVRLWDTGEARRRE
jgi:hypothetical protein